MIVFCAGCGKVVTLDNGHGSGSTHGCCDECNAHTFRSQVHREVKAKPGIPGVVSGPPYPLPGEAGVTETRTYPLPGPQRQMHGSESYAEMQKRVEGELRLPPPPPDSGLVPPEHAVPPQAVPAQKPVDVAPKLS